MLAGEILRHPAAAAIPSREHEHLRVAVDFMSTIQQGFRLEIAPKESKLDARGHSLLNQGRSFLELPLEHIHTRDVYSLYLRCSESEINRIAEAFRNPVLHTANVGESTPTYSFDWSVVVGFKPGVTDNVARSAQEAAADILGRPLQEDEGIYSSTEHFIRAPELNRGDIQQFAEEMLANTLIHAVFIQSAEEMKTQGIPENRPSVGEQVALEVQEFDLQVDDTELMRISREGMLALTLDEMQTLRDHFQSPSEERRRMGLGANPTDVELEAIAQTWSEHCKHKIFNATVDYTDENGTETRIDSCFKTYVRAATRELQKSKDWLLSVFHDNAGIIRFNERTNLVYKVETHNSPTALDPYGGAITGIVGVNRDPLGTGMGADLLLNTWGYCFASPFLSRELVPEGLFHPRRLRAQVHKGVIDGGNQSGIPYALGWEFFDERFLGKPLVYCGTVGTLPREIDGHRSEEKNIAPGDAVVMVGGRIGKDGIHGATFSSEELHSESPQQAVQIGDPITQKRVRDLLKEARQRLLYRSITDNGAGGLSSSVGEMAETAGGCDIDLARAPLKYPGLQPWEILLSEAQERMTLAVPQETLDKFLELAERRDVEATVLGRFTDTGKFHVRYEDKTVAWLDIDFLHHGLPDLHLKATWSPPERTEPEIPSEEPLGQTLCRVTSSLNICSCENKARQYDHEVKGLSVIKPYIGVSGNVQSDATVSMTEPLSEDGIALGAGVAPRYSDIDPYHMMGAVIDMAVRRVLAVGGSLDHTAGLDNFCWPDPVASSSNPDGEYKMAQLVRANQALHDYTLAFGVPCISGKDSMKNDSTVGGRKISIPPTVLFSTVSRVPDIRNARTLEPKCAGDLVYIVGTTADELGGSELYAELGETGRNVPVLAPDTALDTYKRINRLTEQGLCRSLHAPAFDGLGAGFAKMIVGSGLGLDIDLNRIPSTESHMALVRLLFSESASRFILTASPEQAHAIEQILDGAPFANVGRVTQNNTLTLYTGDQRVDEIRGGDLVNAYTGTLADV